MLPTLWIDSINILIRGDTPIATLRFYAHVPEGRIESARLTVSIDHLRKITSILNASLERHDTSLAKEPGQAEVRDAS
jgi:hypothetical protein